MSEDVEENRNLKEASEQEQMRNDDLSETAPTEIEKPESVPANEENKVNLEIENILKYDREM